MCSLPGYHYRNGRHVIANIHGSRTPSPKLVFGTGAAAAATAGDTASATQAVPATNTASTVSHASDGAGSARSLSPFSVLGASVPAGVFGEDADPDPLSEAFVIGITGGSASGKTSVAEKILSMLPNQRVAIVSQDSFYRNLTPEELPNAREFNWDCPEAFDWELQRDVLRDLRHRRKVEVPVYDYVHNCRSATEHVTLWNVDVVIFEGILSFYKHPRPELCLDQLMDLKIFVETDSDTRLARRMFRDTQFRGRSIASVLAQYSKFVKPSYDQHIAPLKRRADIIIPWGDYSDNVFSDDGSWKKQRYPALDMIVEHIHSKLTCPEVVHGQALI